MPIELHPIYLLSFCSVEVCLPLTDHVLFLHLNRPKRPQLDLEAEVGDFHCLVSVQSKRNLRAEIQDDWNISNTMLGVKRKRVFATSHIFLYLFFSGFNSFLRMQPQKRSNVKVLCWLGASL
jgi:hypothetical protein